MSMHNSGGHKHDEEMQLGSHGPEEVDASAGFEQSDVRVTGIVVFLAALGIFVVVTAVLCYGMGKIINAHMDKEDGPNTRWTTTADIRQLGNLANNPAMQNKVAQLAQQFPSPRLQEDDGNQEITDIHAREDLLLDNYSWADPAHDKVRIPIEEAMALVAKRGLPVAPAVEQAKLMTGDSKPVVKAPLTNGFARTGYEQEQAQSEQVDQARAKRP